MSEWQVLRWPLEPGHYFTSDLEVTRKKILESGRNPKVALYKGQRVTSLTYVCTQAVDGCKGTCVIQRAIDHEEEILAQQIAPQDHLER